VTSIVDHRPSVGGEASAANPAARPQRRSFPQEYRERIVAEYRAAPHGQKGAVLRREGLYQSQLREWSAAVDARVAGMLPTRTSHHGKRDSASTDIQKLRAENARLTRELNQSQAVVAIMGKLQGLLETISESTATPPPSTKPAPPR
jgi:transposase-like protein